MLMKDRPRWCRRSDPGGLNLQQLQGRSGELLPQLC
jgi:hypothetical protein